VHRCKTLALLVRIELDQALWRPRKAIATGVVCRFLCCSLSCTHIPITTTHRTRRYTIYKDHVTLADYEIHDGMNLELYYT